MTYDRVLIIAAILACVFFTIQTVVAMSRNWRLAAELAEKQDELALIQVETEAAEIENEYYASEEYQELAARAIVGKKLAGEHLVALPENSAEAQAEDAKTVEEEKAEATEYSNFEMWMRLIFPKG